MAIVMSLVFTIVAIFTSCGQERLGSHFELARRAGAQENIKAGKVTMKSETDRDSAKDLGHQEEGYIHKEIV